MPLTIEELFQQGIELFNSERFFECHEAWEAAWLRSNAEEKLFYQGMIQAAAAVLHAQRGNPAGSRGLWGKALEKLAPLPAQFRSIALEELRRDLTQYFAQLLERGSAPDHPPKIRRLDS